VNHFFVSFAAFIGVAFLEIMFKATGWAVLTQFWLLSTKKEKCSTFAMLLTNW
jgi:hypothetical protein